MQGSFTISVPSKEPGDSPCGGAIVWNDEIVAIEAKDRQDATTQAWAILGVHRCANHLGHPVYPRGVQLMFAGEEVLGLHNFVKVEEPA